METGRRGRDVDTRAWRRRYSRNPGSLWRPLAEAILEASYEATLLAAALNARANPDRPRAKTVFLTALGGGVFGNGLSWISRAIKLAMAAVP